MTALSSINSDINLDNLYKNAVINDVLTFIQHGSLGTKGESNKKKRTHLGYFSTKNEAAEAYNKKAIELWGDYAKLNDNNDMVHFLMTKGAV